MYNLVVHYKLIYSGICKPLTEGIIRSKSQLMFAIMFNKCFNKTKDAIFYCHLACSFATTRSWQGCYLQLSKANSCSI